MARERKAPARLAVFLHDTQEPDYVTEDVEMVQDVIRKYGTHSDMLVMANDLAELLERSTISHYLAHTEDSSMVRLVLS